MLPSQLSEASFSQYPPEARSLAVKHLSVLRQLPLAFEPLMLREVIAYDWKFPAERRQLDHQFSYLASLGAAALQKELAAFSRLRLSAEFDSIEWVNRPVDFSEKLSAHLWATHQHDAFRSASVEYVQKLNASHPASVPSLRRLSMVVIGEGVNESGIPLFRKLRPYGTHFTNVEAAQGMSLLLREVADRARRQPEDFAHWYIDGGHAAKVENEAIALVSYASLDSTRLALVDKMRKVMQPGGGGSEALRSMLSQMRPEDLGLAGTGQSGILNRFRMSMLTEGSGTQLFSTTFVQWSAREALRRAEPLTLLARFAPRQREESMKELLAGTQREAVSDPQGSLVDADMGAYYTWVNLQRLPDADHSSFLVWFEGHNEALAIAPSIPHAGSDANRIKMSELLARIA